MSQPFRTKTGGRVDRSKPVRFTFDGRRLEGCAGDTLASALLANGVHLMGRSFKYHRPRGVLGHGAEDPNALVGVDRGAGRFTPNLRATQVELYEGLKALSQNRSPSLRFDLGAINDRLGRFIPAGFYYKTFMWPASWWHTVYEPWIRRMAGLGKAPTEPDPDRYQQRFAHCEVLGAGAGPAGLAAALAAAETGARVILCDEQNELGGSLLAEGAATIEGRPASLWLEETVQALGRRDNVRILTRTQAFGYFADNFLGLVERITDHIADPSDNLPRERMWQVRAKEVVLATGSIERPLVFPENDRPGIMLAESGRTFLARFGVEPGTRAVIATSHDAAYRAALELTAAGIEVAAVADLRPEATGELPEAARAAGIRVETSAAITGTKGRRRVSSVDLGRIGDDRVKPLDHLGCDLVLMSGGWTPAVHLFSQSRGKLRWDEAAKAFLPGTSVQRERSAGACVGAETLDACLGDGWAAGERAARAAGRSGTGARRFAVANAPAATGGTIGVCPHHRDPSRVKAFVDFQNDVTAKDLKLATQEGFRSIEHVKRYTTTGMATDQGKTSNMNALAFVSETLNTPVPKVGLTTFRPPYTPVTFGAFAGVARGELFDPVRRTPIHAWAEARGAAFEDVGLWKRAHFFPQAGEDMHDAVARECRITREAVGMFDASTLGKIEVTGPDAAEFLNRIYTNPFMKLAPGRCRYALQLNEQGFVYDDGVVARLEAERFHVTTTTGGAPRVLQMMEDYLQTEWPDLKVWLTSITEQYATIALNGPKAREVLEPFVRGIELGRAELPNMSVRTGEVCGVPTRLFRMSFTGELGFEVNVPADYGLAIWEALWPAVQKAGGTAYGTETMHVLRAEKGYVIVGQDTDGTVTPDDLGMSWAIGKTKTDFVGKRSLVRPDMVVAERKQLVGLLTEDPAVVLEEGAQVAAAANDNTALGHVTSSYFSTTLDRSIALALVAGGRARTGAVLQIPNGSGAYAAKVVGPVFYDPEGARLDV